MNARTLTSVLAALLLTSPALAAAPRRSAKPRASTASSATTSTAASSTSSSSERTMASSAESAPYTSTAARSSSAPVGTGQLYLGGYAGLLVGGSVAPNLGLQVAGPIRLQGMPSNLHLEWLGALDFSFSSESESVGGLAEVEGSSFSVGLLPGARIVVPVTPQFLLHGDLSLGLAVTHASASSSFGGNEVSTSDTEVGALFRLAAGAIIPLNERLRFNVTPLALQTYTSGGTAWSIQVGLSYALQ